MIRESRLFAIVGAIVAFLSIALGAFGAHALKTHLSDYGLGVFQTAVDYQMFHAMGILFLAILVQSTPELMRKRISIVFYCFVFGLLFFCGSLYALAITGIKWLGAITPIGGTAFLVGWGILIDALLRHGRNPGSQD